MTGKLLIDMNGLFISSGSAVLNYLSASNISAQNASFEDVEFNEYYAVVNSIEKLYSFMNTRNNISIHKFNYYFRFELFCLITNE